MKEKTPLSLAVDDKPIRFSLDDAKSLQRFWWALGQFHQLLDQRQTESDDEPSDVLALMLESVGGVFEALDMKLARTELQQ